MTTPKPAVIPSGYVAVYQVDAGFNGWQMGLSRFMLMCTTCFCAVPAEYSTQHQMWDNWVISNLPGHKPPPWLPQ